MHALADPRARLRLLSVATLLLGIVLGMVVLRVAGGTGGDDDASAQLAEGKVTTSPTTTPTPGLATSFKMSSLNALGADHTAPGGNKRGWASGEQRMTWLSQIIRNKDIDVLGLQEFEKPQYDTFMAELGTEYATFPGMLWGKTAMRNSVAWRLDTWQLVSTSWIKVPYFHGTILRAPIVLLRNINTGQQAYFSSFHNPADTRGPAQKWRNQATELEISMVNRLRAQSGLPVYVTGDMNERDEYFCRMTAGTDMVSASGGYNDSSGCGPTRPTYIDWIFGSPETSFTNFKALRTKKIQRSTDHPMIITKAELPPVIVPPDCPTTPPATPTNAPSTAASPSSTPGHR